MLKALSSESTDYKSLYSFIIDRRDVSVFSNLSYTYVCIYIYNTANVYHSISWYSILNVHKIVMSHGCVATLEYSTCHNFHYLDHGGWWYHTFRQYGKIKNVPNHQPVFFMAIMEFQWIWWRWIVNITLLSLYQWLSLKKWRAKKNKQSN